MQNFKSIDYTSAIFKTNPRLTGNVKFIVDGNNITMSQLNEYNKEQSNLPYSNTLNFATNVGNFLQSYVGKDKFYTEYFNISEDNNLRTRAGEQFDYQYQYGAKYGNSFGKHRFLAPLWITDKNTPKYFVILARQKQPAQYGRSATSLFDTMKFEIIKTIDIENGAVGKMIRNIVSFPMFRNEPLVFNTDSLTVYGIDISKKAQSSVNKSTKQLQGTEYTLMEADNYMTNVFMENGMIIQNLINLEFEFELPNFNSMYEVVGYYVDDVNNIPVNADFDQANYNSVNAKIVRNTLTASKKYNDVKKQFEFSQYQEGQVYPPEYDVLLRKLATPTVSFISEIQNRFVQFQVRKAVATGDYVSIIEDGKEHTTWCNLDSNAGHFFKYSADISKQMENLNDAIQRLNTKYLYKAVYDRKRSNIIIECMNFKEADATTIHIDTPDGFYPLIFAGKVPNQISTKYRYEFSAFSTFKNTLVINNIDTSLSGINIEEISYTILNIDGVEKRMIIKNVLFDYDNNRAIVIFADEFELGDNLSTKILLSLYTTKNIEICQLQFYDVLNFDYTMKSYDLPSKHNANIIVSQLETAYTDTVSAIKSQFPEGADLPYISSIDTNQLTFSGNPYERLKEYDLQSLSTFNKINIGTNKWGSSKGLNCYGQPISANVSISYNQSNLSPVFDSEHFHNIQSLQYDYFVIGMPISDSEVSDFTTEIMTIDKLKEPDAIVKYFTHKVEKTINEMRFTESIKNYTKVFRKKEITNKAFAIFKGVEYELPTLYDGYRFTVVHVQSVNSLTPKVSEIINVESKNFIIAIEYPITDTILTGVENEPDLFKSDKLKMHRYVYYSNINDVNTANKIDSSLISAEIKTESITIGRKMLRHFKGQSLNDFKILYNGIMYFAIDVSMLQELKDVFVLNRNASFEEPQNGYSADFRNIVDIQDNYVWVQNMVDNEGFDLVTEYGISGDYLGVNQKVNIVMSKMAGSTLYSKNYITTAKRYYPISFTRFVRIIDLNKGNARVSKSKNAVVINYLKSEVSGLSHTLVSKGQATSYKIQRYALNCTPICTNVLTALTFSDETLLNRMSYELKELERLTLPKTADVISDFGIFKIGDANTLTTDDQNSGDRPVHTMIGEVIYDLINYPADFSPYTNKMRFYVHRNNFVRPPVNTVMVNHSGILSNMFEVNKNRYEHRFFGVTEFRLNVLETMAGQLQTIFGFFTPKAVTEFAEHILSKYHYTVKFYDFDGDVLQPILDADYLQSNIYDSHYTLPNPSNVVAVIELQ